jgi:hypothetical protein
VCGSGYDKSRRNETEESGLPTDGWVEPGTQDAGFRGGFNEKTSGPSGVAPERHLERQGGGRCEDRLAAQEDENRRCMLGRTLKTKSHGLRHAPDLVSGPVAQIHSDQTETTPLEQEVGDLENRVRRTEPGSRPGHRSRPNPEQTLEVHSEGGGGNRVECLMGIDQGRDFVAAGDLGQN